MKISRYRSPFFPQEKEREKLNALSSLPVYLITDNEEAENNISNCLATDADRYALSRIDVALSIFCRGSAGRYIGEFMQATVYGTEITVLEMLERNPSLLMERGHIERGVITDYSKRKYSGLTAYQLALCAGDDVMARNMKDLYLKKRATAAGSELKDQEKAAAEEEAKTKAQAELDKQFDELFPNGYQAHLNELNSRIIFLYQKVIIGILTNNNEKTQPYMLEVTNLLIEKENLINKMWLV